MKRLILVGMTILGVARGSEDGLCLVSLPLDTIQGEVAVVDVPFVIGMAMPDSAFTAIGKAYVPPAVSFHEAYDLNVASRAGLSFHPHLSEDGGYRIEIDFAKVSADDRTEVLLFPVLDAVRKTGRKYVKKPIEIILINLPQNSPLHRAMQNHLEKAGKEKKN